MSWWAISIDVEGADGDPQRVQPRPHKLQVSRVGSTASKIGATEIRCSVEATDREAALGIGTALVRAMGYGGRIDRAVANVEGDLNVEPGDPPTGVREPRSPGPSGPPNHVQR